MKKLLSLVCIIVIISQVFTGCSANKNVQFKEFYSLVIGFSENDEKSKPVPQDTILMSSNEEFLKFKDKYFTARELRIDSPDKEKAVLYIQIPSDTSSVNSYKVESINAKNKILTVNLKQSGMAMVKATEGFNGKWKWVLLVEMDKTNLKNNMKIVINK